MGPCSPWPPVCWCATEPASGTISSLHGIKAIVSMKSTTLYRNASWIEQLGGFLPVQILLGIIFTAFVPATLLWGPGVWGDLLQTQANSLLIVTLAFTASAVTLRRILRFPGEQVAAYILPTIFIVAGIAMAIVLLLRLPYSNTLLVVSFPLSIIWFTAGHFVVRNRRQLNLAVVPFGHAMRLEGHKSVRFLPLQVPQLPDEHVDGIVADLLDSGITAEWQRFLAHCTLNHIPVYHIKQIRESLTGRVRIDHLSENEFGTLLPDPLYMAIKRLGDILAVIMLIPIAVPVTLVAGFIVCRESEGGAIFTQDRIGYRGKPFKMFKIRTMRTDVEGRAVTEDVEDPRITPVGRFLRKYRIDELPQLLNVLRGEMSLIGPRPGPVDLQEWYEEKVPFFSYRHVVRPGLSGWAQVRQGYAADENEMREKLEYDFYYIKHFSLWLDMLIVYKTIRTIVTGFGSR